MKNFKALGTHIAKMDSLSKTVPAVCTVIVSRAVLMDEIRPFEDN